LDLGVFGGTEKMTDFLGGKSFDFPGAPALNVYPSELFCLFPDRIGSGEFGNACPAKKYLIRNFLFWLLWKIGFDFILGDLDIGMPPKLHEKNRFTTS
jgi:hypothetical protein